MIMEIAHDLGVAPSVVFRAFTAPRAETEYARADPRRRRGARLRPERARPGVRSTGALRTIGLIVPDIANPFVPPMIRAAQRTPEAIGHTVLIADTDGGRDCEQCIIDHLLPQP
ncbi:MAG TPA: hypothetical protein VK046_05400 [Actinomycetaceae bacterium]|nr:hypothetical protein [Actinomycetaceae bacterium]